MGVQRSLSLRGVISDKNHARVASATITIDGTGTHRQLTSDETGSFQEQLPEGVYRVVVSAPGFKQYIIESLRVAPNTRNVLNIQ
ncbi:MAG: hypothetical protein C5B55_13110, partial [Blastocatellia bacterium]